MVSSSKAIRGAAASGSVAKMSSASLDAPSPGRRDGPEMSSRNSGVISAIASSVSSATHAGVWPNSTEALTSAVNTAGTRRR